MHALAAVDRLDVAVMVRLAVDDKASKSVTDWLLSHDQIETCTCSALFLKIDRCTPLVFGTRGRRFKSCHSDHLSLNLEQISRQKPRA